MNCEECVYVCNVQFQWLQVEQDVRQRRKMAPWFFNVYMDHIVREVPESFSGGVKLEVRNVQFLLFVDGLMLVAEKEGVE